ncbi:MAG: hypothetical protein AAF357_12945 [Verrucomicrobiota bacterium]
MNPEDQNAQDSTDISPALPLEISADLAMNVDEILQDFAEGAELETALVVERSGALVSGISSEEEVMVEIISALVAGASGAMTALVKELGSTGNIESFHQSEERAVYLAEIMKQFVLVGVSSVPVPVGVIREKARQIRPALIDLLDTIEVSPLPVPPAETKTFSLRDMALTGAPAAEPEPAPEVVGQKVSRLTVSVAPPVLPESPDPVETQPEPAVPEPGNPVADELVPAVDEELASIFEAADDEGIVDETPVEMDSPGQEEDPIEEDIPSESEPSREPTEVIELLNDESPEIVIEDSSGDIVESPFEAEDDDNPFEADDERSESIFELEEDDEEEEIGETETAPVFELDQDDEEEAVIELDDEDSVEAAGSESPVFEVDEEPSAEEDSSAFELDFDDFDEKKVSAPAEEISAAVEEEAEEEEASSSGPFYF